MGGGPARGRISRMRRTRAVKSALLLTTPREEQMRLAACGERRARLDAPSSEWVSAGAREKKKKFWLSTRPCLHAAEYPQIVGGLSRLKRRVAGLGRAV